MKSYLYIFCLFLLIICNAFAFDDHDSESAISNYTVKNAQWITPSDGTAPRLQAYDAMLHLSDGKSVLFHVDSSYLHDGFIPPAQFAGHGDMIKILREGFHSVENGKSWFEVMNQTKGWKMILKGSSLRQKNTSPLPIKQEGFFHVVLPSVRKVANTEESWEYIFNLHNTTLIAPISSDKFHNFYDGMIVQVINIVKSETDQYGNYHYDVELALIDTGEVIIAKTLEFNAHTQGVIASIEPPEKTGVPDHFKILLEDHHELFVKYSGSLLHFEQTFGSIGDTLDLQEHYMKECDPSRRLYCKVTVTPVGARSSQYTVKNLRTEQIFETLQSPLRKERMLSIVNSYDLVLLDWGQGTGQGRYMQIDHYEYLVLGAGETDETDSNIIRLFNNYNIYSHILISLFKNNGVYAYMPVIETNVNNKREFYFPEAKIRILARSIAPNSWFVEKITQE